MIIKNKKIINIMLSLGMVFTGIIPPITANAETISAKEIKTEDKLSILKDKNINEFNKGLIRTPSDVSPANNISLNIVNHYGGNDSDIQNYTIPTKDNGYFSVGKTKSTNIHNNGEYDCLFIKYDKNDNIEWANTWGGNKEESLEKVIQLKDGSFIAVGYTSSNDIGDKDNNTYDSLILKISADGQILDYKIIKSNLYNHYYTVKELPNGNFIVGGRDIDINECLIEYDANLNEINRIQLNSIEIMDLAVVEDGYVVVGYNHTQEHVVKINTNGDIIWGAKIEEPFGNTIFSSVTEDTEGNIIATGIDRLDANTENAIIYKFDKDGNKLWNDNFGGNLSEEFQGITVMPDGGYLVVGITDSTDIEGYENKGVFDGMAIKYDKNGNKEYFKTIAGNDGDVLRSSFVTNDGRLMATGFSRSTDIGLDINGGNDCIVVEIKKDNITNKKTTSQDLNIQVVADNTLEMALSTNQISFTGYNGTQDLVNNDLNITISSGLNYDLFATMKIPFTATSDPNAVLNNQNLGIKTSIDTNYQYFETIGSKYTLVSNANNGKDNVHNINFKLLGDSSVKADTYNTTIEFEAVQK